MRLIARKIIQGMCLAAWFAVSPASAQTDGPVYIDLTQSDPCWIQHSATFHEWTCAGSSLPPEGQQYALSLGLIASDTSVMVIDSGATAMVGRQAAADVQRRFPERKIYILNTQPKPEHVLGNIGFRNVVTEEMTSTMAFEGRIVASKVTADLMKQRCPDCIQEFSERMGSQAVLGTEAVVPGLILSRSRGTMGVLDTAWTDWNYVLVNDIETEQVMMLHNEKEGVYWVGNAVQKTLVPDLWEGSVAKRLDYLYQLQTELAPGDLLLGVHGAVSSVWLSRNISYFKDLHFQVLLGMQEGASEVEIIRELTDQMRQAIPNFTERDLRTQQLNVQRVYRQLEASLI